MKNLFITVLVFFALTLTQAFAYNISDFSNDPKILSAMRLLEQNGEYDVFANLKKNAVKVKFYNVSAMTCGQHVYAVNTYDGFDRRVILINSMYKDAPVEQIACLIAHESCHVARKATLEEETIATQKEAACWTRLKNSSKVYPQTKLTKRLDNLAGLYLASDSNTNYVQNKIASSSFYRNQFGIN